MHSICSFAELELERRHLDLSKMKIVHTRIIYRPLDVYQANETMDFSSLPKSTLNAILNAKDPDPRNWTFFLCGNWSSWLELHSGSWNETQQVFEFFVSIPVGVSEFKFIVNDQWGKKSFPEP